MDVVLEVADTFMFDAFYAAILPTQSSTLTGNATFSSLKEQPTAYTAPTTWQYEPSSKYFSLEPSQAAYQSQWVRDDWRRQLVSLYLITWYVPIFDPVIPPLANPPRTGCLVL
jgi:lathosterol oxidase